MKAANRRKAIMNRLLKAASHRVITAKQQKENGGKL